MTDTAQQSLASALSRAVDYLAQRYGMSVKDSRAYPAQRKSYMINIFGAMNGYLTQGDNLVAARNEFSKEMIERFYSVFVLGYTQAGGSEKDLTGDSPDLDWINARTEEEIGYIKSLFVTLREAKQSDLTRDELKELAQDHADAYTNSLDMVYSEGRMRGAGALMLTMVGEDGNESCSDCRKRKGKRYSAKKWLAIGYPPSRDFECHGYNCQHYLIDDKGKRWTR
jgi:hypothetical protein